MSFCFVQHLPVVLVTLGLRELLVHEPAQVGQPVGRGPASVRRSLGGGELRRVLIAAAGRRLPAQRRLPLVELLLRVGVVHIANRHDVLAHERTGIAAAHPANADNRDVQGVAGRLEPTPEHMSRDDDDPGPRSRGGSHERAAGHASRLRTGVCEFGLIRFGHRNPPSRGILTQARASRSRLQALGFRLQAGFKVRWFVGEPHTWLAPMAIRPSRKLEAESGQITAARDSLPRATSAPR